MAINSITSSQQKSCLAILIMVLPLAACSTHVQNNGAAKRTEIHRYVDDAASKHNIPKKIAHAVVRVESNYNCRARNSRSGALGAMQVLPATARSVGVTGNLTDCRTGIDAGMRYLRQALDKGGSGCEGVSLYERGIFASPTCSSYGQKVMQIANAYNNNVSQN